MIQPLSRSQKERLRKTGVEPNPDYDLFELARRRENLIGRSLYDRY